MPDSLPGHGGCHRRYTLSLCVYNVWREMDVSKPTSICSGAFEGHFLFKFKIRFDKPTVEAKRNIWMSKLPSLSVEDAHTLASSYEFSGGQIDNIVRKALMQEVIKGEKPTLNSLVTMCSEEKISKNTARKIGFC